MAVGANQWAEWGLLVQPESSTRPPDSTTADTDDGGGSRPLISYCRGYGQSGLYNVRRFWGSKAGDFNVILSFEVTALTRTDDIVQKCGLCCSGCWFIFYYSFEVLFTVITYMGFQDYFCGSVGNFVVCHEKPPPAISFSEIGIGDETGRWAISQRVTIR